VAAIHDVSDLALEIQSFGIIDKFVSFI